MNKYGISTEVLDTYVADFHGTTQVLFEQETPEQQFNKPVCYDCHGVHDIARTDDPQKGLLVREKSSRALPGLPPGCHCEFSRRLALPLHPFTRKVSDSLLC